MKRKKPLKVSYIITLVKIQSNPTGTARRRKVTVFVTWLICWDILVMVHVF